MSVRTCCACGLVELPRAEDPKGTTELRPYGPDGAPICFPCAMHSISSRREAEKQFGQMIDAAWKTGGGVAVLTKDGPKPVGGGER